MNPLRSYKNNWLLYTGMFSIALAGISSYLLYNESLIISRNYSDLSLTAVIIASVFVAPLTEEFIFRGLFAAKKWMKIISLITLPIFVLTSGINWLHTGLLVLFGFSFIVFYKTSNKLAGLVAIISNIFLFASVHYEPQELANMETFYFAFFQLGLGALLIWVILNFSIWKAVLVHFAWNFSFTLFTLAGLHFVDEDWKNFENDKILVEWKEVPRFQGLNSKVEYVNSGILKATNIEARKLYKMINLAKSDSLKDFRILQYDSYKKYNFEISYKIPEEDSIKEKTSEFLLKELIYLVPR